MAQPWTESAPIDFGKFAESGISGAIKAQEQFAEQSKNFSDLLIKNIDDTNKAKNTLQAVELIKSLDVDSSKDLFKSGNLADSISTIMGTNHIGFDSSLFTTALTAKHKDIKDNDTANLDTLLAKPENYKLLAEDPEILKAENNLVLSTSEIQASQKKGRVAYTTHLANKLGNDPNNVVKSPLDIKQEILTNYGNVIDEDTLNSIDIGKILSNSKQNITNANIQVFRDRNTISGAGEQNADGTLKYQFSESALEQAKNHAINSGNIELANKLEEEQFAAIKQVIDKDPVRLARRTQLETDIINENMALDANVLKQFERALPPNAQNLAASLVNEVTNANSNKNIDQYLEPLGYTPSQKNLLKTAYNLYGGMLNVSPSTFHKLLMDQGIFFEKYDPKEELDTFLADIQGKASIQSLADISQGIPGVVRDIKTQYQSSKVGLDKKLKRELRNIANTRRYTPGSISSINNALYSQVGNAWQDRTTQLDNFGSQIAAADAEGALPDPYNSNFDDRVEYGLGSTAPYVDSAGGKATAALGTGVITGLTTHAGWKWLRNALSKTPPTKVGKIPHVIAGIIAGGAMGKGYDGVMDWWYGKDRYGYDPKKVGKAIADIEGRFAKGALTQHDIDFIIKHSKYSGSLGPELHRKLTTLKQDIVNLNSALRSKNK